MRVRRLGLCVVVLASGLVMGTGGPATAGTIVVAHTEDSAAPGSGSLRDAIRIANASPGNDVIVLESGEAYGLTRCASGSDGDLDVSPVETSDNLTIKASGKGKATIVQTCDGERVIESHFGGFLKLQGIRISGGTTATPSLHGAGVRAEGSVILVRSAVVGNSAGQIGSGGGVHSAGDVTIVNSVVSKNSAGDGDNVGGQGAHGGGVVSTFGDVTIKRSRIAGNSAGNGGSPGSMGGHGGRGGGVYAPFGRVRVMASTIQANASGFGGPGSSFGGFGGDGGGVYADKVVIARSTLAKNVANPGGVGSSVNANDGNGGAITASKGSIEESTISGNKAAGYGGGVAAINAGSLALRNTTVTKNVADADDDGFNGGGGLARFSGTLSVQNTLVAGNRDRSPDAHDCAGEVVSRRFNIIGKVTGCTFTPKGSDTVGSNADPVPPRLRRLADNGGRTATHALRRKSAAVNHGPLGSSPQCGGRDQRSVKRPEGRRCDTGSFERRL